MLTAVVAITVVALCSLLWLWSLSWLSADNCGCGHCRGLVLTTVVVITVVA